MTFRPRHEIDNLYFVTGAIVQWTPIFTASDYRSIIFESLNWHCANQRMKLFAYVVMSDHLHWISYPLPPYTINDNIWSFASYTAHEVIKVTKKLNDQVLLHKFSKSARLNKSHKIWRNFQAKNIYSQGFLLQKMEYIHNNPLGKFHLDSRTDFPYSSARYYDEGKCTFIQIEDIFDFLDRL